MRDGTGIRETDRYVFFWNGEYSNWHPWPFKHKGHNFENSEQAFMWEKAMFFGDTVTAEKVLNTPNPAENKKLGRQVTPYDNDKWAEVRYDIMVEVNFSKWITNPDQLLDTGSKTIVEASPVDKIWGIGLMPDDPRAEDENNWDGQNLLGFALMEVRNDINEALASNPTTGKDVGNINMPD